METLYIHGILQARTLEWVAFPFSKGSSLRIEPRSPALQADLLTAEPEGKPSGDTDIENRLVDTVGERKGGMDWETSIETYLLPYVKLDNWWEFAVWCKKLKLGALWQPRGVGWGGRGVGREAQQGGSIHITLANSCWYMAEPAQYCQALILQL